MRMILVPSLLFALCSSSNAATVHHAQRHHVNRPYQGASDPASGFASVPPGPPIYDRQAPYNGYNEPYLGASQGYAPGEYSQFLDSVRRGG